MDAKLRERFTHRLSPQLFSSDEGPETGDESDEDMIRDYLPPDPHEIPAINITLHSPNSNHVLESEICQLADIQENIQRMREGEAVGASSSCPGKPSVEARLSSSCPSLNVESGEEGSTPTGRRRQGRANLQKDHKSHRKRTERQRSLSVSTGESNDDSEGGNDLVDGRNSLVHPNNNRRDRAASAVHAEDFRSGLPLRPGGGNCVEAVNPAASKASPGGGPAGSRQSPHLLAQLPQLHKSVSTPSMVPKEASNDSSTASGKTSRRTRLPEPTHVFIQKLIAEHGWTHQTQRSGTESETEGEEGGPVIDRVIDHRRYINQLPSPQLTLAEFLENPALAEEEQRKRRRNKKERGGSLFSLRKKKDKKDGKGLAKAGSAVSLQSRVVTAPRIPQHSYSMSSLKRYPPPQTSSQFYLARSESSKSTEEREDVDGDREALLEAEHPPGMEMFPEGGPAAIRNLDTDPFLRIQKEEPETWAASVPEGVAAALKPHEAKRQEHIYEFIMTEKHHCQLLKVMQKVFKEGMVTCLDVKQDVLDRIFPQLDELISLHFEFLRMLRERQDSTAVIPTIADILLAQFQGHTASRWKASFGAFCSQHSDAVTVYKDILKSDRRFQEFVQECSHNPLLHKRGIPESILTVTTRITKYPLLIEPLIKTAKERPEEQQKLRDCHRLVRAILVDVNNQVAEKERGQRLLEIYNRMDARSSVSYEGRKFKKSDMMLEGRKLLFDGTGTLHQPGVVGQSGGRSGRSPSPLLINVVVLSDVLLFLQDSNQKYSFVTPDNKSGVVPVHSLIAREKPGTDTKALYLISTSDREPEMYELTVSQPRDRHDWISGIRRAVDLSTGGSPEDEQFEVEAEEARNQLDARFMKLRGLTSELRGRDMELAKLLEEKMRLLGDMLDVLGVENPLPGAAKYLHLVQEQNLQEGSITKEKLLEAVQEASRLASSIYSSNSLGRSVSSVGEHQSEGYESPSLPKRAETFGGFDATLSGEMSKNGLKKRGLNDWAGLGVPATPPLLGLDHSQQAAAVHMTHYLNNIMCMVSEHFTSLEGLKVELAECREKAALGWGRYKHNQQLEELRNLQEELALNKRTWQAEKAQAEKDLQEKKEAQAKLQASLDRDQKDIEEQRNKLFRKLEALSAQGIDFAPNMTVIGPTPTSDPAPVALVMEVRKTVSPHSVGQDNRKPSSLPPPPNSVKKTSDKNQHLLSATNETKGDAVEVKQQIPSKLAKLSMSGTAKKDKKSQSVRPSISGPILTTPSSSSQLPGQQQMLPFKLSEQMERKTTASSLSSPKQGYQKLSSSSFVEERVGRLTGREEANHTRTGSSPAAMTGRPMSNTLPKAATRAVSPETQDASKGGKDKKEKFNYADSGEEVFFF